MNRRCRAVSVFAVSLCILSVSDAFAMGRRTPAAPPPSAPPMTLDTQMFVNIHSFTNYTAAEQQKAMAAVDILTRVLNSGEFRTAVLNHQWKGVRQFADNEGLTNEEILNVILAGKEELLDAYNSTVDLNLEMYYKNNNVVGQTSPGTLTIYTNRKFFSYFSPAEIAGNMIHEWCHKIGFDHDYYNTSKRPYSVPYAVGDLAVELGEKLSAPATEQLPQ